MAVKDLTAVKGLPFTMVILQSSAHPIALLSLVQDLAMLCWLEYPCCLCGCTCTAYMVASAAARLQLN